MVNGQLLILFGVYYFGCKDSNYFLITKQKAEKILFFLLLVDLYSVW